MILRKSKQHLMRKMVFFLALALVLTSVIQVVAAKEDLSKLVFASYGEVTLDGNIGDAEYMNELRYGHLTTSVLQEKFGLRSNIDVEIWLRNNGSHLFVAVKYNKTGYARVDVKAEGSVQYFSFLATVTDSGSIRSQVYLFEGYNYIKDSYESRSNLTGKAVYGVAGKESGGYTTLEFAIPMGTSAYLPGERSGKYVGSLNFYFGGNNDTLSAKPTRRAVGILFYLAREGDDLTQLEEVFFHSYDYVYILSWTLLAVAGVVFVVVYYFPRKKLGDGK